MAEVSCHIGTSGWSYEHWKGPFYPDDMAEKDFLSFFSESLRTVEINNSFYHLPSETTFRHWHDEVDEDFIFAVKASRYITHMKKLKDPQKSISNFFNAVDNLSEKCGPILFQLPPYWHVNTERLKAFLETLPENHFYAFEFRDESWFDKRVYDLLSEFNAAFCIYDMGGNVTPEIVTADFVYVRFHGPGEYYRGCYTKKLLNKWAKKIQVWMSDSKNVYCYFNNDQEGYAVANALTLRQIVNS